MWVWWEQVTRCIAEHLAHIIRTCIGDEHVQSLRLAQERLGTLSDRLQRVKLQLKELDLAEAGPSGGQNALLRFLTLDHVSCGQIQVCTYATKEFCTPIKST